MKILARNLDLEATQKSYKKVVWFYDFWSWLTESKATGIVLKLADIKDHQKVLEVACGTGVVFEQIVRQNPNGTNTGVDLSPDMLRKAKKRLHRLKQGHYTLMEGDVLNLKFRDNSFDIIINNFMVDLMPLESFDKIADEFYRMCKPSGIIVVSTFSFGNNKLNRFWYWIAEKIPDLLTGCRPVSFSENLIQAGFEIEKSLEISQNTFPSEVIKARKA